jgi:hypothetical protein
MDRDLIAHLQQTDQLKAETVEQVRWAFATFEDAGTVVGKAISEAAGILASRCDHAQLLLRFLSIGAAVVLEEVNRPAED